MKKPILLVSARFARGLRFLSMESWSTPAMFLAILLAGLPATLGSAEPGEEQTLISLLQSNATPRQKDAACARLKRIGTDQAVPALAALLNDEALSHSARYALESMSSPAAGAALVKALPNSSGEVQVGIIQSLGSRRETSAMEVLIPLLGHKDSRIAEVSAWAIGRIGGSKAVPALFSALPAADGPARGAVLDALLACAELDLENGQAEIARGIFQRLYESPLPDEVRAAAFRGLVRSSGSQGLSLLISAIRGADGPGQVAALQLAHEISHKEATRSLTNLLGKVKPSLQTALIGALHQRADGSAAPAIAALAGSEDPQVRLAALTALGDLGDASLVTLLAQAALSGDEAQQKIARQSLINLRRGKVTETILTQLTSAEPALQVEMVRALAGRGEKTVLPRLFDLAQFNSGAARRIAYQAIAQLADGSHAAALVQLVLEAKDEAARSLAQTALETVCQRLREQNAHALINALIQGLRGGPPAGRAALLEASSSLVDPRLREALRETLRDSHPEVREGAMAALAETRDPALLPDLLAVAREATELNIRTVSLRGLVRLVTDEEGAKFTTPDRVNALERALDLAQRPEEKRLILAGLAKLPDPGALRLALPLLDETGVQAEAAQAAVQIAAAIKHSHSEEANRALRKVLSVTSDANRRRVIESIVEEIAAMTDYIKCWQVAGPYEQKGKAYDVLFDVVFPPETPEAKSVQWQSLPSLTNPAQPWLLDLLKFYGGEQRVAYVRTRIYSAEGQPARLELGTDDGVKAWLNGKLVHANNAVRGITPGADKVNVTLRPGWNVLMLKITQHVLGWEFCARFTQPDGIRLEGLRFDASSQADFSPRP